MTFYPRWGSKKCITFDIMNSDHLVFLMSGSFYYLPADTIIHLYGIKKGKFLASINNVFLYYYFTWPINIYLFALTYTYFQSNPPCIEADTNLPDRKWMLEFSTHTCAELSTPMLALSLLEHFLILNLVYLCPPEYTCANLVTAQYTCVGSKSIIVLIVSTCMHQCMPNYTCVDYLLTPACT